MSWGFHKSGRAGALSEVVKQKIVETGSCPKGSAEEAAKNLIGDVAETLCKSLPADKVVSIKASGSAWNNSDGTANSQQMSVEIQTLGDFID